jgi:alpha-mannosidase
VRLALAQNRVWTSIEKYGDDSRERASGYGRQTMTTSKAIPSVYCLILLVSFLPGLQAQQTTVEVSSRLSPESQAVIQRLASLSKLPAATWRYHLADLLHGENPDVDDSGWQSVTGPTKLPQADFWFRTLIEIPKEIHGYALSGTRISLFVNVDADIPVSEIVYFNGRRVALGTSLGPITLFDEARPGDKVLVAVKVLQGEGERTFIGSEEAIEFRTDRPNPADFQAEAASAGMLLPALLSDPAEPLRKLESAIRSVDLAALDSGNQAAFDNSLRRAHSQIMELRPILQRANIQLTGNAHVDAAWLWPWTETVESVRQTFGTSLQLMNEYPKYTFSASAAAYYEWVQKKYPGEFEQIKRRVKEGRWEAVGGMWVEPDLNMPDGESQVRQLLIGKRYFEKNLGVDVRLGWNPDSFGYNWQLPQIYKRSGMDYLVTQKMSWNDTNQLPLKLFWWQAPDGSRVLTYFPHDYDNQIEPIPMAADFAQACSNNPGTSTMMHLYGIGDHGGGPTRAMLDAGDRWTAPDKAYAQLNSGNAASFFSAVESKLDTAHSPVWNYKMLASGDTKLPQPPAGSISLPIWNDELYLETHRGVYTSQSNQKHSMRKAEVEMLDAEKWSSIAWLSGLPYPADQLNEAWKKVLFNQFHDLAAGSGIAPIYADAQDDYRSVRSTTDAATDIALRAISSYINTQGPEKNVPVIVFNPLAWKRTDLVDFTVQMPAKTSVIEIVNREGKILNAEATLENSATNLFRVKALVPDVPSLGYELIYARPATGPSAATTGLKVSRDGMTIENQFLRLTVDPKNGCITNLVSKQSGFDAIVSGGCGNLLQAFKDTPKEADAWNIDSDFDRVFTNLDVADSIRLVEHNALRAAIRITRHWQNSEFAQEITLYNGLPRVDVVNDIDWHERHVLLKASFPLAASSPHATFEIPYGTIERPTTRDNSVEQAKFEVPALRWADLGDGKNGFSLINESKYGYDSKQNVLRLSLLRAPTWPDPEADQGRHHFSYALYPHAGDWKQALTVRQGYDFNYRLTAMQVAPHGGTLPASLSFVKTDSDNVVVTAIKKTEDGDGLLVRFYEWAGKPGNVTLTLPVGALSATQANLMEKTGGSLLPVVDSEVTLPVTPFEIQTAIIHYLPPTQNFLNSTAMR